MKTALVALALLAATPALAQTAQPLGGMPADHEPAHRPATAPVQAVGQVKALDAKAGTITLHHGPIAAIGWPAMTMTFQAAPDVLKVAKVGQTVSFTLQPDQNLVTAIAPR